MPTRSARAVLIMAPLVLATCAACGMPSGATTSTSGGSGGSGSGGGTSGGSGGGVGGQSAPPNEGGNTCFGKFNPAPSGIIPGASVKGTLMTVCTVAPQKHQLNMQLQRNLSGNWSDTNTKVIDRIPGPVALPNLITAPCVPGKWRLVISIDGISATGIPWHVDQTGAEVEIHPNDCG
jgi:hypothetical protein